MERGQKGNGEKTGGVRREREEKIGESEGEEIGNRGKGEGIQ